MVLAIDRKNYRCRIQPFAEGQLRRGQPQPLQAAAVGLPPSLPNIALQTSIVRPIVSFNRDRKTRRTGDDMRNSGVRSWCAILLLTGVFGMAATPSRGHLPPGGKKVASSFATVAAAKDRLRSPTRRTAMRRCCAIPISTLGFQTLFPATDRSFPPFRRSCHVARS